MKIFSRLLIGYLIFSPLSVFASPGAVDQYGGHLGSDYHYHSIPQVANFYYGGVVKAVSDSVYFQPTISENQTLQKPENADNDILISNTALDVSHCNGSQVFAKGLYDVNDKVRVEPVCVDIEQNVFANGVITAKDTYGDIADVGDIVTKVYHYENDDNGSRVFTDMPDISEFIGKIVQGETDMAMYTVIANDVELKLHQITEGYAKSIAGQNYKDSILKFDDSIIYSYPIGGAI